MVYLTFKNARLIRDGITGTAVWDQFVSFPWGSAVSFPTKINYDLRRQIQLHFPLCMHFSKSHCLQLQQHISLRGFLLSGVVLLRMFPLLSFHFHPSINLYNFLCKPHHTPPYSFKAPLPYQLSSIASIQLLCYWKYFCMSEIHKIKCLS